MGIVVSTITVLSGEPYPIDVSGSMTALNRWRCISGNVQLCIAAPNADIQMIERIFSRIRHYLNGILPVFACILPFVVSGQTFNGQGGLLIPPGAPGQTVGITISPVTVSGIGILGEGCTQIDNVTMDVLHTWTGDIALFLISPAGQVLELSSGNGGAADNFSITVFTDFTPLFITQGMAPFNGPFRPEGRQQNTAPPFFNTNPLGTFTFQNTFDGIDADGEWQLYINDFVAADVGIINSWSITFSSGGGTPPEVTLGPDITVCPGQVSTLTADVDPSADSYAWSTGESTPSINVSPSVSTTYSVTVTNDGCIGRDTIEVIIDPNGVIADAGPDVSICLNESTVLLGAGGGPGALYTWSTGQTGETISVSPSISTTYTLTVSEGSCSSTDQVIVTVVPEPIADAGPDIEICDGESTLLEASGGIQNNDYTWSTGQTGSDILVSPISTTIYTVTVDIDGCIDEDDVLVTVLDAPDVDAGPPEEICLGESVTLIATGSGGTYVWSTGQTGDEIEVTPVTTTTYTVTLTSNGCEAMDNVEVEVINVQGSAGPNQSICEGVSVSLTATGGSSYEWSTGQTQSTISVSPTNTTTYFVTVTQGNCFDVASVEVEVVPGPIASVTPDQIICDGETVDLIASGGTGFLWSTGQTSAQITVSPGVSTTYTVTVSEQGCFSTATTTVDVNPSPATSAGDDQQICDGASAQLVATGLSGPGEYTWSTGETGDEITVDPLSTTTYSVTATNEFDCASTDEVVVTVNPIPMANAGPDQDLCEGGTATLNASGGSVNSTYSWSSGQTGQSIQVSPGMSTTYTVTLTDAGCPDTDDIEITVLPSPIASASDDIEICAGATASLEASGGLTYLWSTGQSTSLVDVTPLVSTTYIVTVFSSNGCSDTEEVIVSVNPAPIANAGPDQNICEGEIVTLSGSGGGTYEWSTGESSASIDVNPSSTTAYILTVTDAFGCTATDVVSVIVQAVPAANAGPNQFILAGGTAVLTATGGSAYAWSTGETTSQVMVMPAVTTTYTVTVTAGVCSSVDEVVVFVDEVPTVDLGPDFEICDGETISLDAYISGPFALTYAWSTGQTDSLIQVSPGVDTSYSVTVTNIQSGLTSVDTIYITVNYPPIGAPVISGSGSVCAGSNITYFALAVSDVTLYQWSALPDGTILSGQGTQQIEVMWPSAGTGQVQLIVSNDCGALPAILFDQPIDSPPVIVGPMTGESNPCAAGIYNYNIPSINNATAYQWTLTGGGTIQSGQGTNAVVINWNNTAGGDLCVVASNNCGTSASLCLAIQTVATPVLSAGPDLTGCGQSVMLEGSGVGVWTLVSGPGTAVFSLPGDPTSAVTVDQPGDYIFNYSFDQNGCFAEDETQVSFFNIPTVTDIEELCAGALSDYTVSFEIESGQSPYAVNGQIISGTAFQSASIPAGTPYSFQVTDANGCTSQIVAGLQECNCISDAGTMPSAQTGACVGEKITIQYLGGGAYDMDDTLAFILHDGNLPGGIIYWNSIPDFEFVTGMIADQIYYISAVVGNKGVNGLPDIGDPCLSISNATPIVFYSLPVAMTIGSALLGCDPQSVILDIGQSETGVAIRYFWSAFDGGTIIGSVDEASITAGSPGSYVLMVENEMTGCISSDTVIVIPSTLSIEELKFNITPPSCPGECNGLVSLYDFNETWLFDFGNGVYTLDTASAMICAGQFVLSVKDTLGCIADTLVLVEEPSGVLVDLGPDQTIKPGDPIELTATSISAISRYNWFGADTCTSCMSIVVNPLITTIYTIEVLDENGCSAEDQVTITVLGTKDFVIPNIFSPNGDQINDILYIGENSRIKSIQLFEIFDRWGTLVWRREDVTAGNLSEGWDGTFNGEPLNPGVYTMRIIVQFYDDDIIHKTGDVTLIR
ncbi:MAG: gliding motility-associated C-terminal domain-containing protein [Saprospiraceae bacterium]|nr:gliding motility-associated C-terminal domain-containing protein [Candidatus Opimibacter skivensis]